MASQYRYHKVSPKFWSDRKVLAWDDDTRLLALYLLTCEHRTTEGLFRLPKAYIAADLGWTMERLAKPFAKLLDDGFAKYDETVSVMLLTNALKWNPTENPNQAKAVLKSIDELPETPLLSDFQRLAERFDKRLAEQLAERYGKPPTPSPSPTPLEDDDTRARASEGGEDPELRGLILSVVGAAYGRSTADELDQDIADIGIDAVKEAMRRSVERATGNRLSYYRTIVKGWRGKVRSLEDIRKLDEAARPTRDPPRRLSALELAAQAKGGLES